MKHAEPSAPATARAIVDGMPAADYHAHPALSSSGARDLLPPHCPAYYRWRRDHPQTRPNFELGHAAHKHALGVGPELVLVDRDRWDTDAVKAKVAEIRGRGAIPLKREPYEGVQAMAAALRAHPMAGPLLNPTIGWPEQSLFWTDGPTGVARRARLDWRTQTHTHRAIIVDYKTTTSAAPEHLQRAIHAYGYHQQGAWYLDGAQALGLADADAVVQLIFQEKTPPYLVNVVQLDAPAVRIGRALNRQALDVYRECVASGRWPGYSDTVEYVSLPTWVEAQHREEVW